MATELLQEDHSSKKRKETKLVIILKPNEPFGFAS